MIKPLIISLFVTGLAICAWAENPQTAQHMSQKVEKQLDYLLYLPENYAADKSKKWPLLIFLHGAGERGADLEKVKKHGPPKLIAEGEDFPFIVASPQCPENEWWDAESVYLLTLELEKSHRVDAGRIYLTGLSMGGYATWETACSYPDRFAAIAPICGGGVPYRTRNLKTMPIWVFHGAKDNAVSIEQSENMVEALKRYGNQSVKFTVYPEAGHDSWTETYSNDKLYDWFLAQEKK